ncbi:MAG: MarR family transcriptional regulator [Oscillospiraceae bacterium]|nr:MarR family transcriptional regulator [Oscillospiraceae bacterium]
MMAEYQLMDLFQKITVLNDRAHTEYIQSENPTPLTDTQAIVLHYIMFESRKRDVYAKDVESYFGIKASSVNSLVNYLERAGYIYRETAAEDMRLKKLLATPKARAVEDWLMETIHYGVVDIFAGFTDEEMQELRSLMEKMRVNLLSMSTRKEPHYRRDPRKQYSAEE